MGLCAVLRGSSRLLQSVVVRVKAELGAGFSENLSEVLARRRLDTRGASARVYHDDVRRHAARATLSEETPMIV